MLINRDDPHPLLRNIWTAPNADDIFCIIIPHWSYIYEQPLKWSTVIYIHSLIALCTVLKKMVFCWKLLTHRSSRAFVKLPAVLTRRNHHSEQKPQGEETFEKMQGFSSLWYDQLYMYMSIVHLASAVWIILQPGSFLWKSGRIFVKIQAESGRIFNKDPGEIQVFKEKNSFNFCLEKIENEQKIIKILFNFFRN